MIHMVMISGMFFALTWLGKSHDGVLIFVFRLINHKQDIGPVKVILNDWLHLENVRDVGFFYNRLTYPETKERI